jgi:hypothetical protein
VDAAVEKERWRQYGPELRLILWAAWDPIGAGVPLDEYDSYAPQVWELLRRGADTDEIAAHLRGVRQRLMGLAGDEHDARAADKLSQWWHSRVDQNG